VVDIGCQDGFWSYVFAIDVGPEGKVYALDIDEEWVKYVRQRSEARGWPQIEAIQCLPDDTTLDDESVDVIFIANTIHHLGDIPAYTKHLYRILKPGGRYIVIDNWTGRWGHNSDPDEICSISGDAGFNVSKRHRFEGTKRYLIVFIKPP
jgi:ubiquinone/menaquinone biosynthesis C-methylase UbiE